MRRAATRPRAAATLTGLEDARSTYKGGAVKVEVDSFDICEKVLSHHVELHEPRPGLVHDL
jgi:hypothetical protein